MDRIRTGILGLGLLLVPIIYNPFGGAFLPVKRLALYTMIGMLGIAWILSGKTGRPGWISAPAIPFAIAYVGIAVASIAWSLNGFSALVEATQLVALLATLIFGMQILTTRSFVTLSRYTATAGGIVGILGVLQYFNLDHALLERWGLKHLVIPSVGRPSSTFAFRNLTASYLIGSIPFICVAWVTESRTAHRRVWAFCAAAALLLLIYTRTRGAWVGMLVGAAIAAFYLVRNGRHHLGFITRKPVRTIFIGLVFTGLAQLDPIENRAAPQKFDPVKSSPSTALISIADPGADRGRLVFWRKTLQMIADHPVLGVGLDNWQYWYPIYDSGPNRSNSEPVRPHNDLLWVWSELGPIGLAGFVCMVLVPIASSLRRATDDPLLLTITAACIASAVALFVHGGFSFLREQPAASLLLWVSILGISLSQKKRTAVSVPTWSGPVMTAFGVGAILIGVAHTRFDMAYHVAKSQYDRGDLASSLTSVRRAVSHGMFDHRASFLEGRILHAAGKFAEAADAYRSALTWHPHYVNTHHNLGGVLASQGRLNTAIVHYRDALAIRPAYHEARINLANALLRSGDLIEAKRQAIYVTKHGEHIPEAHALLGAILLHEGNVPASLRALETAIRLKPDFVEAHNNAALAYEHANRPVEAIRAYRKVAALWKGDPGYLDTVRSQIRRLEGEREQ